MSHTTAVATKPVPGDKRGRREQTPINVQVGIILETDFMDQFILVKGNRSVSSTRFNGMLHNMKLQGNLTKHFPVVVAPAKRKGNGIQKFVIWDGQARFMASRKLRQPMCFLIDEECRLTLEVIIISNSAQRPWSALNYLESYVERGHKEYIALRALMDEYPYTLGSALNLCNPVDISTGRMNFKTGRFKIYDEDWVRLIGDRCRDFSDVFAHSFKAAFVSAVTYMSRNKEYDHKRMLAKLENPHCRMRFEIMGTVERYLDMLQTVYNYKVHDHNLTEFKQIDSTGKISVAGRFVHPSETVKPTEDLVAGEREAGHV